MGDRQRDVEVVEVLEMLRGMVEEWGLKRRLWARLVDDAREILTRVRGNNTRRRNELFTEWKEHLFGKCGMCKDWYYAQPNAGPDDFACGERRALGQEQDRERDLTEALDLLRDMVDAWTCNKDHDVPADSIRNAREILERQGYEVARAREDR